MGRLGVLQANRNPSVIKILTIAALEQNHRVFLLDKERLYTAVGQLLFVNRNIIYYTVTNSISIWYLRLPITTTLSAKKGRHVLDESSPGSTSVLVFGTAAPCEQLPATALSNRTRTTAATEHDFLHVASATCCRLLVTGIQA